MPRLCRYLLFCLCAVLSACNPTADTSDTALDDDSSQGLRYLNPIEEVLLISPSSSPNSEDSPVIKVLGTKNGDRLYVYLEQNCDRPVAEAKANASATEIQIADLEPGRHVFYIKRRRPESGVESKCVASSFAYEVLGILITGIDDDSVPTRAKTWTWGCSGADSCEYRHVVNSSSSHSFSNESFNSTTTANISGVDGTRHIHIQARDASKPEAISETYSYSAILDNTAPTVAIANPSDPTTVNLSSDSAAYAVSGTCSESGQTVSILVDGTPASGQSGLVCDGSSFSGTIDMSAIADGSFALSARLSDAAGNLQTSAASNIVKDTQAPTVAITAASDITAANENSYSVVGSCSNEGGQVDISVGAVAASVLCSSGAWSSAGMDVSALADNPAIAVSASQTDAAGNTGTAETSVAKETSTPQVAIASAADITQTNETSYEASGTCTENGTQVDLSIGSVSLNLNCSGGTWSATNIDLSSLADNPAIAVTADHSSASASTSVAKDTTSPEVSVNSPQNINSGNESSYSVSGFCSENGQNVAIDIAGLNYSDSCSSNAWSSGPVDVSSLADGNIGIGVDHSSASTSKTVVKNTTTPSVSNLSIPTTLKNSVSPAWELNNPGGFSINDYIFNYRLKGTTTWLEFDDGIGTETNTSVTGLQPSSVYEVRARVKYDGDQLSSWSNTAEAETKPDDPLFASQYAAMNVGGAVDTKVVALYDNTKVFLNGSELAGSPLSKGAALRIASSQFDIIDADKPIYTAGRRGTGGAGSKANMAWMPSAWAGKTFSFNAIRSNPQYLHVFATEDATVKVMQGSTVLATKTIAKGSGDSLNWSIYGSYQVVSTGTILAFHSSGTPSSTLHDPKPLLPSSKEIIGFPSNSMRITADQDATNYNLTHSNSSTTGGSLGKADVVSVSGQGTSSYYQSESLLISADRKISGASFADSNGYCAAPFMPTALMRKNYVINNSADWVAFASKEAGTIEVRDASDNVVQTLTLARSGGSANAPYRARLGATPSGHRFFASVPMAAWYQPNNDNGSASQDETVLYGSDE